MSGLVVRTTAGDVQGTALLELKRWLGIPYARADRFAAPEPVTPWQGVRQASAFGKQCPQRFWPIGWRATIEGPDYGEDCLNLNIWAPQGGSRTPKPVMVWIHGGAFMTDSANRYDGSVLAREGDIIVVSINYRLGVLGFVNFGDALRMPSIPSNLGLRDQVAALEWVHDNIAAFGGDPGRVTICGQSAGSISVSLLMLSRRARGLFHAAIMQSGANNLVHDREHSIKTARRFAQHLGLDRGGLKRLRSLDLSRLMEVQAQILGEEKQGLPTVPWYDGDLLPESPDQAYAHDAAAVPLIAGAMREETAMFEVMPVNIHPRRWSDIETLLFAQLPREQAERILATYPRTWKGRIALASDLMFVMPTRHFAERHARANPTWVYRFDYGHPVMGAMHALDMIVFWSFPGLQGVFGRGGLNIGRRKALGQRMRAHFAHFIHHHRLGGDWEAYKATERKVRLYDLDDQMVCNPEPARYAAWAGCDILPRC